MADSGPRHVRATARFTGPAGREEDAALAWSFELKYYFLRGVGEEPPHVTYAGGMYTCTGVIQTTHPGDSDPVDFDGGEPWDLSFCTEESRRAMLRGLYEQPGAVRFDGQARADVQP